MKSKTLLQLTLAALLLVQLAPLRADAAPKPLKVFILAGQSNMDGQADVRTIDFLGEDKDPAKAAMLKTFKPDGKNLVTRDDVWVAYRGNNILQPGLGGGGKDYSKPGNCIGPEYAFGYYMGEALDQQILLIKSGPGGTSLYKNWRPPSAGVPEGMKPEDVGGCYRGLIKHVHETLANLKTNFPGYDEKAGYEIVGFVWFQGFNDMIEGGKPVAEYGKNLICLINDLRKEFKTPDMKVVVGVMGVNGVKNEGGKQGDIRNAMRSMNTVPEFKGTVKAVESAPLMDTRVVDLLTAGWLNKDRDLKKNPMTDEEKAMLKRATSNKGFHYNGEGRFFILLGKAFADTMLDLMGLESKVVEPRLNKFAPPVAAADTTSPSKQK
jgi:hypothetical protein